MLMIFACLCMLPVSLEVVCRFRKQGLLATLLLVGVLLSFYYTDIRGNCKGFCFTRLRTIRLASLGCYRFPEQARVGMAGYRPVLSDTKLDVWLCRATVDYTIWKRLLEHGDFR